MPIFGIFSALFLWLTPATKSTNNLFTASYMTDFNTGTDTGHSFATPNQHLVDLTYQTKPFTNIKGLRFGASALYNAHGTHLFGGMLSKTVDINKFGITFATSINYSKVGMRDAQTLSYFINFKTSLDITHAITQNIHAGLGIMHISNAGMQFPNTGINGARATVYIFI